MKACSRCKQTKDNSEFYTRGTKLQSFCRACFNAYCMRRWTQRKHDAIAYLGGVCGDCNTAYHHAAMQFHHRDPQQKDYEWTKLRLKNWESITNELDKCTLLCANCHAIRHAA